VSSLASLANKQGYIEATDVNALAATSILNAKPGSLRASCYAAVSGYDTSQFRDCNVSSRSLSPRTMPSSSQAGNTVDDGEDDENEKSNSHSDFDFNSDSDCISESSSSTSSDDDWEVPVLPLKSAAVDIETDWAVGNWNKRFQEIITRMSLLSRDDPEQGELNQKLLQLSQDFVNSSEMYGRIIILERYLEPRGDQGLRLSNGEPRVFKTINSMNLGGQAGGDKYVVNNILFKFAVDRGLFGSDSAAAKAAGNELRGLTNYFNLGEGSLHVPLMALVDYMGFRLIALSLLPIDENTLRYGSADAGLTVRCDHEGIRALMREAASELNLCPHVCGVDPTSSQVLYSAADVEGHLGTDGRIYLVDFSRAFPPTSLDARFFHGHLYQVFRPEFVRRYEKPLCPDAFSGFVQLDPLRRDYDLVINQATRFLLKNVVPNVANELKWAMIEAENTQSLHRVHIPELLHGSGVNLRYIGYVLRCSHHRNSQIFLLVEALSRVIKNRFRKCLRERMKKLKLPLEAPYRVLTVDFFNLVFGDSIESEQYWKEELTSDLRFYFYVDEKQEKIVEALAESQGQSSEIHLCNLRALLSSKLDGAGVFGRFLLFQRLKLMCGVRFSSTTESKFSSFTMGSPLTQLDIERIGCRVKHMNIIEMAQGTFLFDKATRDEALSVDERRRLLVAAIPKYENALETDPNNREINLYLAECWCKVQELSIVPGQDFDPQHPVVIRAEQYYYRAISAAHKRHYVEIRLKYASFLEKCGPSRRERAETQYIGALEHSPNHLQGLLCYANFLRAYKQEPDLAALFEQRVQLIQAVSKTADGSHPQLRCPDDPVSRARQRRSLALTRNQDFKVDRLRLSLNLPRK